MDPKRRSGLIMLCLALGTAAIADVMTPTIKIADLRPKTPLAALIPASFGEWVEDRSIPVVLPSPDVQANLNKVYNQVLARTYVNRQGYRIMLSVAYGGDQSDGVNIHRPEICYPAQGFDVSKVWGEQLSLAGRSVFVSRALTQMGPRREPVTYWIVSGDEVIKRGFDARLVQLRYTLRGKIPDGMLVRVSSIDGEPKRAFAVQDRFANDFIAGLAPEFVARIVGRGPL